jgi:hypothetical protein
MRKNVSIYFNNSNLKKIKCYVWINCIVGNIMDREGSLSYKNNGDSKFIFCHPKIGIDPFGNIRRKIAFHTKTIFDVLGRIFGGSPKLWLCPRKQQSPDQITRIPSHVVMSRKRKKLPPGDDMTP